MPLRKATTCVFPFTYCSVVYNVYCICGVYAASGLEKFKNHAMLQYTSLRFLVLCTGSLHYAPYNFSLFSNKICPAVQILCISIYLYICIYIRLMLFHPQMSWVLRPNLQYLVMDLPAWKNYRRDRNIYWCINSYNLIQYFRWSKVVFLRTTVPEIV